MGKGKPVDMPSWRTPELDNRAHGAWCFTDLELLRHPRYIDLTPNGKNLLLLMACLCGSSKPTWFNLPYSVAKKYGFARDTFQDCIKDLVAKGFLEVNQNAERGLPNEYRFTDEWKLDPVAQEKRKHFNDKQ